MNGTPFISPHGPNPVGPYPHARRVGEAPRADAGNEQEVADIDIPGVTRDASGNVASYDIEAQCRSVFENIRVILEDAGAKWENIVDVTSFLTDMKRDFAAYNKVYEEHFAHVRPTRTTVEVGALPTQINVELKVIAWLGK